MIGHQKHFPQRGFSLIELLASAAILGILASIAVPVVETTIRRQKEQELRVALRDIRQALDAYRRAAIDGNIEMKLGDSGYPPSLTELVAGVTDKKSSTGRKLYFLRRIPRDPTATQAITSPIETWGKRCFNSAPEQPAEGDDVFDVYSKSAGKGLNGVPYVEW